MMTDVTMPLQITGQLVMCKYGLDDVGEWSYCGSRASEMSVSSRVLEDVFSPSPSLSLPPSLSRSCTSSWLSSSSVISDSTRRLTIRHSTGTRTHTSQIHTCYVHVRLKVINVYITHNPFTLDVHYQLVVWTRLTDIKIY